MGENVRKVIVDVDVGTDDFLALLLLFYAEKIGRVKIEAIVCSMGNATVEHTCKNAVRLLEVIGRTDVPIYRGVSKSIILPRENIKQFHGKDGFGDLKHDKECDLSIVKKDPAVQAIRDIVMKYPKSVSLICVAPLTNLALAVKLFEEIATNIKDIWIMGGNHSAVGNITSSAEYNFYMDPEAAYIVFECSTCPIYLLPWETCLMCGIPFHWRYNVLQSKTAAMQLLTRAEKAIYNEEEELWMPCDSYLVFAFLDPGKHITKSTRHNATVELHGSFCRGQVILDHLKNKPNNVTVIEEIDVDAYKKILLKAGTEV